MIHPVSRRGLVKLGALTLLASAVPSIVRQEPAWAQETAEVCNPGAPTTAAAALAALIAGNHRWASGTQKHPGEDAMRRACLANPSNKQTPFASILACSDSRVGPELIFDMGLGEIFVARVAGNTEKGPLLSTLLYGTDVLLTPLLVVVGHTLCGAVEAAVTSFPFPHKLAFVNLIFPAVRQARMIVKKAGGDPKDPAQVIPVATQQNVLLTVRRLRNQFQPGPELSIVGGVYDLGTQLVTILTQ
jgi:carbonic anhydrase